MPVVNEFLVKHKAENYRELVDGLVDAYQMMGCRKSLKVGLHVLHACLDKFKDNMRDKSEEQGEGFTRMSGLLSNATKDNTVKV